MKRESIFGLSLIGKAQKGRDLSMNKQRSAALDDLEKAVENGEEVIGNFFDPSSKRVGRPFKKIEKRDEIIKSNLDLTTKMASELDEMASSLNISRQALIKVWLRQALDTHYIATRKKKDESEKAS